MEKQRKKEIKQFFIQNGFQNVVFPKGKVVVHYWMRITPRTMKEQSGLCKSLEDKVKLLMPDLKNVSSGIALNNKTWSYDLIVIGGQIEDD